MTFEPTQVEFRYEDPDGYSFEVISARAPEFGWSAYSTLRADGLKTPEAAVKHLRHAAEAFLRVIAEMEKKP